MREGESFVIDANIVKAVFEATMGHPVTVSADPEAAMEILKKNLCRIVLDEGGHIIQEWRDCVEPEWFEDWYFGFVSEWNVASIKPRLCNDVLKKLRIECGFPGGENKWLVHTAITEASINGICALLSEDMDFREPRRKNAKGREKYLTGVVKGSAAKLLSRHGVKVMSLWDCA